MKFTITLPSFPAAAGASGGDVYRLVRWAKEIGEAVAAGDILATLQGADGGAVTVPSPAFGILVRKVVLPGEAIEVGEPLAVLAGVPESLLTPTEARETAFTARPPYVPGGPEEIITLTPVQQAVAEHMTRSAQASPHVYTVAAVDVAEALRLSDRLETDLLPFIVASVASALIRHPALNAERAGETRVRRKQYRHLGITGYHGSEDATLRVAVIREADRKSVRALAQEIGERREQMRAGNLPADAARGATFTIALAPQNAGIRFQTPILHQPQAALLSVGAVERTPVADAEDRVVVRPVLHLCLAHDARLVTTEEAAAFLADVKTELEDARFLFNA